MTSKSLDSFKSRTTLTVGGKTYSYFSIPLAEKKVKDEAARIAAIGQGDTAAKWLDAALRTAGVLKEGERL